jgi:NADH-ubiquinone oxidoreductase chain 5
MYLLIISLPLLGTIFSGFFGFKLGVEGATKITVYCITAAFLLSVVAFYEVALMGSPCYLEFFKWFDSELLTFSWGLMFDTLTVVMLVVVTSISMCVHIYSTEYMSNDPHIQRFMSYLSLFTFFMLILVTADNFFQLFLGWEGVGLCSYLLVNFWFGRIQANKAALKAMIVNRIGDIGLAIGIFLIYYVYKSIDYSTVFAVAPLTHKYTLNFFGVEFNAITLICFFFFIAATGKSAQIGLHTWLPDAMEGPTPVSALIHAATMVTAGVFLIVRCSPLFEYAPTVSLIITISGAMTAFMAASIGLVQNDLKRVIAYSTCSQLGYMMVACGTSGYAVGMFHLTNHAFFKALLFLSAGSIIHALSDEQDMRKMGGLLNLLPFTYSMMLIGSMSLMGFPFLTGFYSKDLILEWTFSQFSINGLFAYWMGSISAFFTAFYSLRVISLTFLKKPSAFRINLLNVHEAPERMAAPLLFLSFFSIFIGYFFKDMFVGLGTDFWGNSIYVLPQNVLLLEAEFLDTSIKIFPVCLSLLGATSAFILYNFYFKILYLFKMSLIGRNIYIFFNRKWFFDKIYNYVLAHNILTWSYVYTYQNLDRGLFELIGPTGLYKTIYNPSWFTVNFYNTKILSVTRIKSLYIIFYSMFLGLLALSYFYFNKFSIVSFIEQFWTLFTEPAHIWTKRRAICITREDLLNTSWEILSGKFLFDLKLYYLNDIRVKLYWPEMLRQYVISQKELLTFALNGDVHGLSGIFRLFEGSFYPFSMEPINPVYIVNERYAADIEFIRSTSADDMALAFKEETLAFNTEIKQIGEMEASVQRKFDIFAKDLIVRHLCDTGDAWTWLEGQSVEFLQGMSKCPKCYMGR